MGYVVAFILVCAAGACTCLGASLALFAQLTNKKFLAGSLGAAAGVMTYISLIDILATKSVSEFALHLGVVGSSDPRPFRYANFCFFAGMVLAYGLDLFVHSMIHLANSRNSSSSASEQSKPALLDVELSTKDAAADVQRSMLPKAGVRSDMLGAGSKTTGLATISEREAEEARVLLQYIPEDHRILLTKIGLLNMLAVGLHNLPEGLVTFISYAHDPKAGFALAAAIALHNIPEGVVVGMPIYYASGSRLKAFTWTFITGAFEVLGGIIGWIIVTHNSDSYLAHAVLFGLVAGIMVHISVKELLPTALKYDPEDTVTTNCFLLGVVVMAASLILLAL